MNALLLDLPVHALALPGMSQESLAHEVKFMLASSRAGVPIVAMDSGEIKAEFIPND